MSAQPYFRSRAPRRERDAELERLVAAELDTLVEPPPPAPANDVWTEEISAAERDFVDLVRQWLDRRPNKHQLLQLICDGVMPPAPVDIAPMETSSLPEIVTPDTPAEPDSHAAP